MRGPWKRIAAAGACALLLLLARDARADMAADFNAAGEEMKKPLAQQNAALIEQKLASIVAAPDKADAWFYLDARKAQIMHHVQMMTAPSAPENVQKITQECLSAIADYRKYFLTPAVKDHTQRALNFSMQFQVARMIPDPAACYKAECDTADALVQDFTAIVLNDPGKTVDQKLQGLKAGAAPLGSALNAQVRSAATAKIHAMMAGLDIPSSTESFVARAGIKIADGQTDDGLKDLAATVADPKSPDDVRNLARARRMQVLATLQKWTDASADADALLAVPVAKTGGKTFAPADAAQAKLDALRVKQALGQISADAAPAETVKVLLEALSAEGVAAEEKSKSIAVTLTSLSKDAASRGQWDKAAGLARAAYSVAPNDEVPATVTLLQQLLANRSRYATTTGFNVARSADDLAKAQAFYARQSGSKTVGDKTVVLKADLSNDADFPRALDGIAAPFDGDVKAAVDKVASSHPDPMTRALAQGLLGQPDAAIATMSAAVTTLGLESAKVSDYVNFTARFVRAKLESVALANAFLQSQVYGPAGKDGVLGTADDTPNPLGAKPAPAATR